MNFAIEEKNKDDEERKRAEDKVGLVHEENRKMGKKRRGSMKKTLVEKVDIVPVRMAH